VKTKPFQQDSKVRRHSVSSHKEGQAICLSGKTPRTFVAAEGRVRRLGERVAAINNLKLGKTSFVSEKAAKGDSVVQTTSNLLSFLSKGNYLRQMGERLERRTKEKLREKNKTHMRRKNHSPFFVFAQPSRCQSQHTHK
jgi:hypothetical protein